MFSDTPWTAEPSRKRRRSSADDEDSDDSSSSSSKGLKNNKTKMGESIANAKVFSKDNHIYFYGGVSKTSVYALQKELLDIETKVRSAKNKSGFLKVETPPIYLHINSYGGGVFAAFAAIDMIEQCKIPVYTIVEGATASAGTLMSVVGKKRFIRPHGSMLIHQLSSWMCGKMAEIDDEYQNLTQMMGQIKDIYKKHTKIPDADLDKILKKDLWWSPDKCLEVGLVDKLWKGEEV